MGQKFAAYDGRGNITAFYDSVDSPVPPGVNAIEISDAEWQACITVPGYTVSNGQLTAPTAAQVAAQQAAAAWMLYQQQAQEALAASDKVILRCYENAVSVPTAWASYRKTLRAVVGASGGDPTTPLPIKPVYPAGT